MKLVSILFIVGSVVGSSSTQVPLPSIRAAKKNSMADENTVVDFVENLHLIRTTLQRQKRENLTDDEISFKKREATATLILLLLIAGLISLSLYKYIRIFNKA